MEQSAHMVSYHALENMKEIIIDSHVHLWPASAANPTGHAWMQPGDYLAQQHSLDEYVQSCDPECSGIIYVETDRALGNAPSSSQGVSVQELQDYALQPIEEIRFLRRIVEGQASSEGSSSGYCGILQGIVLWAPHQLDPNVFSAYLKLIESIAGQKTWSLVKGFRFLLQSFKNEAELRSLVLGHNWIQNLKNLGANGFAFDLTVDSKRSGTWQLQTVIEMARRLREVEMKTRTRLILDHIGKPDIEGQLHTPEPTSDFTRWKESLAAFAEVSQTYVKLSGAFSEMGRTDHWSDQPVSKQLEPWIKIIFEVFQADRIMFGSDWPICNVNGPDQCESWTAWRNVVREILQSQGFGEEQQAFIWSRTAIQAYDIAGTS